MAEKNSGEDSGEIGKNEDFTILIFFKQRK